jgi:hypothetical protein
MFSVIRQFNFCLNIKFAYSNCNTYSKNFERHIANVKKRELKNVSVAGGWWLTLVILPTQEAEIRGNRFKDNPEKQCTRP